MRRPPAPPRASRERSCDQRPVRPGAPRDQLRARKLRAGNGAARDLRDSRRVVASGGRRSTQGRAPGRARGRGRVTIASAIQIVLGRLTGAEPILIACGPARSVMGLTGRTVLHAGPPLGWETACETMRAAILCAIRYEGWAADDAEALDLLVKGEVEIAPCHAAGAAGPITGMVTPSLPVFLVEERRVRGRALATPKARHMQVPRLCAHLSIGIS